MLATVAIRVTPPQDFRPLIHLKHGQAADHAANGKEDRQETKFGAESDFDVIHGTTLDMTKAIPAPVHDDQSAAKNFVPIPTMAATDIQRTAPADHLRTGQWSLSAGQRHAVKPPLLAVGGKARKGFPTQSLCGPLPKRTKDLKN